MSHIQSYTTICPQLSRCNGRTLFSLSPYSRISSSTPAHHMHPPIFPFSIFAQRGRSSLHHLSLTTLNRSISASLHSNLSSKTELAWDIDSVLSKSTLRSTNFLCLKTCSIVYKSLVTSDSTGLPHGDGVCVCVLFEDISWLLYVGFN